jgi:S1-C subfamily serine protease
MRKPFSSLLTAKMVSATGGLLLGLGALGFFCATHKPSISSAMTQTDPLAQPEINPSTAPSDELLSSAPATAHAPTTQTATTAPSEAPRVSTALSAEDLFRRYSPGVVCIFGQNSKGQDMAQGSGFFVSDDGLIVTNLHVIGQAQSGRVQTADGTTLRVVGVSAVDSDHDLAVLKVDHKPAVTLTLSADSHPPIGTRVWAIGNPEGLTNTISEGIVSGVRQLSSKRSYIQTTAPMSHGSSGGVLLTDDGRVLGVTSAIMESGQQLNFAVPADAVNKLLARCKPGEMMSLISAGQQTPTSSDAKPDLAWVRMVIRLHAMRDAFAALAKLEPDMKDDPEYWYTLGTAHYEVKNYPLAVKFADKALELKNDYIDAARLKGDANLSQKQYRPAIAAYERVAELGEKDAALYATTAICYLELNDFRRAEQFAKHAIKLDAKLPSGHLTLARTFDKQGQTRDALGVLESAMESIPGSPELYLMMGGFQLKLSQTQNARQSFQKVILVDSRSAAAGVARNILADMDRSAMRNAAQKPVAQAR